MKTVDVIMHIVMAVSLSTCLCIFMVFTYAEQGYLIPNDEEEKDRLDIIHELMLTLLDRKLFLAPVSDTPARVLDLGTGTGIWAIDFGKIT